MKKAHYIIQFSGEVDEVEDSETINYIINVINRSFKPDLESGVSINRKNIDVHIFIEPKKPAW